MSRITKVYNWSLQMEGAPINLVIIFIIHKIEANHGQSVMYISQSVHLCTFLLTIITVLKVQ